jgi:hypothetical protein
MAQTLTQFGKFFRPTVQRTDKIIATRNDKNARDIYRSHNWFVSCERFSERGSSWLLTLTILAGHLPILRRRCGRFSAVRRLTR